MLRKRLFGERHPVLIHTAIHYRTSLSKRRVITERRRREGPEFDPRSVRIGFVVKEVALKQIFPQALLFSQVSALP